MSQQLRQLAAEGYRWRDMGVCARNMEVYGPLLESVFRRDGIPAYISRRSDLLEKPPITMLLGPWTPLPAALTGRTCSAA